MDHPVYKTFDVEFEHTTTDSSTPRQNRRVITIWGDSEFKAKAEIERQEPSFRNVVILTMKEYN